MVVSLDECILSRDGELDLVARSFQDALLQHTGCQRVVNDENRRPLRLGVCGRIECLAATALSSRHEAGGVQHELRGAFGIQRSARDHGIGLDHARKRTHHDVGGAEQALNAERDTSPTGLDDHGRPNSGVNTMAIVWADRARAPQHQVKRQEGDDLARMENRVALR